MTSNQVLNLITIIIAISFAGDIVNGIIGTAETGFTFGKVLRGGILLSAFVYLLLLGKGGHAVVLTVLVTAICVSLLFGLASVNKLNLSLEIVQSSRVLYTPVLSIFFLHIMRPFMCDQMMIDRLFQRLCVIGLLISLSVIVPTIVGVGYKTYGSMDSFGNTGVLLSQNEIALTLICLQVLSAYRLLLPGSRKGLIFIGINGLALILIGTRTAIVGSFLIPIVAYVAFIILSAGRSKEDKKRSYKMLLLLMGVSVSAALVALPVILSDVYLVAKFASLLTSLNVREGLMQAGLQSITAGSVMEIAFGQTATVFYQSIAASDLVIVGGDFGKRVEVDWIDIWGIYGLLGVLIIYGFYLVAFARVLLKLGLRHTSASAMILFLFLAHSVWAGHAVMAPMPGSIVAVMLALSQHQLVQCKKLVLRVGWARKGSAERAYS